MKYSFGNQEVWQTSKKLVNDIYQVTSTFLQDGKFGLTSLLRRTSITVNSNIAEGSTHGLKKPNRDFTKLLLAVL